MRESISLTWRRIPYRYRLEGTKCEVCGNVYFPPRTLCPKCRSRGKIVKFKFSGKGKVHSLTEILVAPTGLEKQVPYIFAIIELDEGVKILGQIVCENYDDVKIGDKVEVVFRKIQQDDPEGLIHYGLKFRLVK